jgi:alpha,alpha-trehalase
MTISRGGKLGGDLGLSHKFEQMANSRKAAINATFWNEDENFFFDFDIKKRGLKSVISTAALFPLFSKVVDEEKAMKVAEKIKVLLLKPGGILCTPINSGQQWDAPNGWAPLQFITVIGLMNYNLTDLALDIAKRWTALNVSVFKSTGKMLEKYNVENLDLKAGGGEYPVQDGFGWTNGVYLELTEIIKKFEL